MAFSIMLLGTSVKVSASDGDKGNKKEMKPTVGKSGRVVAGVEIYLGRHWSRGCPDRGICKIKIVVAVDSNPTLRLSNNNNHGTLVIDIPAEYIRTTQPEKMQYFEGQSSFIVERDFELDKEVCKTLETEENLIIKAGNYPMTFRGGIYTIIIGDML